MNKICFSIPIFRSAEADLPASVQEVLKRRFYDLVRWYQTDANYWRWKLSVLSVSKLLRLWNEYTALETHSQIWPYFSSFLLTCEVDLFKVLEILAQMWHYINQPTKVTSDFIVNYLKNLKTNTKTLIHSIWMRPQEPQGCQKMRQDPLNTPFEVWCAKIAPRLKSIQKSLWKQGVFWHIFFQFWQFLQFVPFLGNFSARTRQFYL